MFDRNLAATVNLHLWNIDDDIFEQMCVFLSKLASEKDWNFVEKHGQATIYFRDHADGVAFRLMFKL